MEQICGIDPYFLIAAALWTLPWKAWALWLSARRGDFWWFVTMVVLSTLGLIEIFYIFFIAKQSDKVEIVK